MRTILIFGCMLIANAIDNDVIIPKVFMLLTIFAVIIDLIEALNIIDNKK